MSEQKESFWDALAAAILAMCFLLLMGGIIVGGFFLQLEAAKNTMTQLQKDLSTENGHLTGKVSKVETWKAEKFSEKDGNITITLDITDRCRITFEDGRSKEFLGMPKEPVPTDKLVTVTWAKYDLFLAAVDAAEYKAKKERIETKGGDD
jgi:hypothetical protein